MAFIRLPEDLRSELKDPLGPVYTEIKPSEIGNSLVTVGDIVTYHFLEAGILPDVSVVDGKTKREDVSAEIVRKWLEIPESIKVKNPAGTITSDLIEAIREALKKGSATRIEVDGEEDLAVLPAIAVAKNGSTIVYGQPDEGMVYVSVNPESKETSLSLIRRMEVEDRKKLNTLLASL